MPAIETIVTPRFHLIRDWRPVMVSRVSAPVPASDSHADVVHHGQDSRGGDGTPADLDCDVVLDSIPGLSDFTIVDTCAGVEPIPILEPALNLNFHDRGSAPVRFVMPDLWPSLECWTFIPKWSENVTHIAEAHGATKVGTLAEPGRKECRIYNLCFHLRDDDVFPWFCATPSSRRMRLCRFIRASG
jgi:hypothetical protein